MLAFLCNFYFYKGICFPSLVLLKEAVCLCPRVVRLCAELETYNLAK